jgi:hypothetical protein
VIPVKTASPIAVPNVPGPDDAKIVEHVDFKKKH